MDECNDEEVREFRQAQVRCSISSSASTFIKNLGKKVQEVVKEHLDAKGSEKEHIEET